MNGLSVGQLRALSDFFNTVAAAWFTGGVITPFFVGVSRIERWLLFAFGLVFTYAFLSFSLSFAEEVD